MNRYLKLAVYEKEMMMMKQSAIFMAMVAATLVATTLVAVAQEDDDKIAGQSRQYWITALQNPHPSTRMATIRRLRQHSKESSVAAVQMVATALADEDASVRASAASNLAWMGPNAIAALDALTKALDDNDARVRASTCDAFAKLGNKAESAARKIGMLAAGDKIASVRAMAAQSLGSIGAHPEMSVMFLKTTLDAPEANVRLMAAQAIGRFGRSADSATQKLSLVATIDGDLRVRRAAISTLGTIGHFGGSESQKAVSYLTKCLSDSDPEIRRLTAFVLSRFGEASQPAIPKLVETLRDGPAQAQVEAASTLGSFGPVANAAVPVLLAKVKSESHLELRGAAAKAVVRIDPNQLETVLEILIDGTKSEDSLIRLNALMTLLRIDCKRADIVLTLKRLQNDKIVDIQLIAAQWLARTKEPVDRAANELPVRTVEKVADPKVTLNDGTQKDAEAALTTLRTFLDRWQEKEYAKAAELVDERIRYSVQKHMEQERNPFRLRSIDKIRLYKSRYRTSKNVLRAYVDISKDPKGGFILEMVFRNGTWWITSN